ncbi:MAG: TonB-dependent receptor [Acidovorax sp.]|nr:TonB-dependent receptor [Acidovorax sp.]
MLCLRTPAAQAATTLVVTLSATLAHAAGDADTPPAGSTRPEVTLPTQQVVGQRDAQRVRKDAPVARIVVSEEEVERFGDATVGDVLRRLPGMGFTGPAGVVKDIRMRGMEKGYTQFLINGEPIPTATKDRQIQVDRLPADMIERIEIIRSPSAAMDSDGIGGSINIVLKQTADNLTRLRAAYGKNGHMNVGDVVGQWSRQLGDLDVVLALSHTVGAEDVVEYKDTLNAAGTATQREVKPKPAKKTETLLSPRVTWRNGADRLTLDAFASFGTEEKRETSTFTNAAGALSKRATKAEDKDDTVARLGARYDGQAPWGQWFTKGGVQQARIDRAVASTETSAAGVQSKRATEDEDIKDRNHYAGAGLVLPVAPGHLLSSGLEWRDGSYDNLKRKTENGADKSALGDRYLIEERRLIGYLQDEWRVGSKHWLTPGLRVEQIRRVATDGTGRVRESDHTAPQPSVHYRWEAQPNLNLRASWSRTQRLGKYDQVNPLVTGKSGTLLDPDTAGNPNLRPERSQGLELGLERFFEGLRGVVGANAYYRDVKDYIQNSTQLEGLRYVQRPRNVAEARFWGLELDWRIPIAHKGAHALNFTGSHAELRGRALSAAKGTYGSIKDMPPRITSVGMDWTHRPTKWSVGANVNYQPAFTTDGLNDDGVREIKRRNASTLLDIYVTKIFSPTAELRLVAKNVLSVKKRESAVKYASNGGFASGEAKTETSNPTLYITYEARF